MRSGVRAERRRRETTSSRSDGGPEGVRAAGPNHLSGRANQYKQQVREDFAGLFYLLLFSTLSPVLIKTMGYVLPDHLAVNQVLYQCRVLCDWNLSIALQRIV